MSLAPAPGPRRSHHLPAFTLVELLVVIAIIALLIGILLPALAQSKFAAKATLCLSNTRSIGQASTLYAQDYKTYIPRANGPPRWFDAFLPYMNEPASVTTYTKVRAYRCPTFPIANQTLHFVVNGWHFTGPTDMTGQEIIGVTKLDVFDRPSSTGYITENDDGPWRPVITSPTDPDLNLQDLWQPGHLPTSTGTGTHDGRRISPNRHFDGCNLVYLDGHAAFMKAKRMTVNDWRDKWR